MGRKGRKIGCGALIRGSHKVRRRQLVLLSITTAIATTLLLGCGAHYALRQIALTQMRHPKAFLIGLSVVVPSGCFAAATLELTPKVPGYFMDGRRVPFELYTGFHADDSLTESFPAFIADLIELLASIRASGQPVLDISDPSAELPTGDLRTFKAPMILKATGETVEKNDVGDRAALPNRTLAGGVETCPISRDRWTTPVLFVEDGHTYNLDSILTFVAHKFATEGSCRAPLMGSNVTTCTLVPNRIFYGDRQPPKAIQFSADDIQGKFGEDLMTFLRPLLPQTMEMQVSDEEDNAELVGEEGVVE